MQSKRHNRVTEKARETLGVILEHVLRDECFLLEATHDYRWRVTGPNLYSLHRLFDEQRRQLDYWLDRVIDRTKSIGLSVRNLVDRKASLVRAESNAREHVPAPAMVGDLLSRHEALAQRLREDVERLHDPTTADLLRHLAEFHETTAWMLRMVQCGPDSSRVG